MYVRNGIAYAGESTAPIRVLEATACDDYSLNVQFSTGERKRFSFLPYLDRGCFRKLKDLDVFKNVRVDCGCPTWDNGNIDIAPEALYEEGVSIEE